jgi:hypothetical protein
MSALEHRRFLIWRPNAIAFSCSSIRESISRLERYDALFYESVQEIFVAGVESSRIFTNRFKNAQDPSSFAQNVRIEVTLIPRFLIERIIVRDHAKNHAYALRRRILVCKNPPVFRTGSFCQELTTKRCSSCAIWRTR